MGAVRKISDAPSAKKRPPATTPEGRNAQLAALAYDLVEERLRNGSATSQETVHFLKAESMREKMELELMSKRAELLDAQREALASAARVEELAANALEAFKSYVGGTNSDEVPHAIG